MFSDADELLGLATPRGGEHGDDNRVPSGRPVSSTANNDHAMENDLQVRTMEVPRWLSTTDVTCE